MREGNLLYDNSSRAKQAGLLTVYDVLQLWPDLKTQILRGQL
jgi:hypothetical protein